MTSKKRRNSIILLLFNLKLVALVEVESTWLLKAV